MKLLSVPLLAALLVACGDPTDRAACATSATCPAGQYCDVTGGAGVCWPDAVPPTVGAVTVTCSTAPCARDAVLTVEATAADDVEVAAVRASLDLDGGVREVELARVSGALYRGQLSLAEWPFGGAEETVRATVTAADGARNVAFAVGAGVVVRRARGAITVENGALPSPASLTQDGTVVVGAGAKLYFLPPGSLTPVAATASLVGAITQPPSIGTSAIWVAAGTRVYALSADGATVLNGAGYDTTGAVVGPPALSTGLAPEIAFAASVTGRMYAVRASATGDGLVDITSAFDPFSSGPILSGDGVAYGVTATAAPVATLRRFSYDGALGAGFTRDVGKVVTGPLAHDLLGSVWSGSADLGQSVMQATTAAGAGGTSIPSLTNVGGGPAILAGGDVVFCDGATVRRHAPDGTARWASPPTLAGAGLTPMALTGGPVALLVPTKVGTVHALDAAGQELWSVTLAPGTELREGNLFHAPGAPTSTAWFTSAGGTLHGLVVDGRLDPAAPWPKAWHDPRNTGNAATPLPP